MSNVGRLIIVLSTTSYDYYLIECLYFNRGLAVQETYEGKLEEGYEWAVTLFKTVNNLNASVPVTVLREELL